MGMVAESRRAVLDLHAILSHVDPARWKSEAADARRAELEVIALRLAKLGGEAQAGELGEQLSALAAALRANMPAEDEGAPWFAYRKQMSPMYLAIAESFRERGVHLPSLRPTNYVRNAWHVMNTSISIAVLLLAPDPVWVIVAAGCFCFPFWFLEWIRRRRPELNERIVHFFRFIVHPHEAVRVNSATWFATALFLLALTRSTLICVPALAVLGAGDPIAALVGRRFGRVRLAHGRTLEGSLAFLVAATAAAWIALTLTHGEIGPTAAFVIAFAAGLGGALAELLTRRLDDNLTVPIAACVCAAGAALALGVPLL